MPGLGMELNLGSNKLGDAALTKLSEVFQDNSCRLKNSMMNTGLERSPNIPKNISVELFLRKTKVICR